MHVFEMLTSSDIELRCCGFPDVNIELLKEKTNYNDCWEEDNEASERIKEWFWKMLEEFTPEQRTQYLKFVWGRAKLPTNMKNINDNHCLEIGSIREE